MKDVAATIRKQIDLLAEDYEAGLSKISDYARVPESFRRDLARTTLLHIATSLENGDGTDFIQFIEARISLLLEQGFRTEAVMQAVAALETVVMPLADSVEAAIFLWQASAQARTLISRRTTELLRESEQKFRAVADNVAVGVLIHQDGRLRYIGREGARLLGYETPGEMLNHSILDFIPDEERARIADIARRRLAGEVVPDHYETRLVRQDGTIFEVLMYSTLIEYEGRTATQGTFLDITGQKRTEEALRTIFNSVHDAIFLHELDGTVIDVNDKMLEMYGVSKEQALILSIADDFSSPNNSLEQLPRYWENVVRGEDQLFEWKARRPNDGSVFEAEVYLTKIQLMDREAILATVSDISDRKQAEAERRRMTAILEATSDLVSISTPTGELTYMNLAGRELVGWSAAEDISRYAIPDVHPAWVQKLVGEEGLPAAMRDGIWQGETAVLHRDGYEIPVSQVIMAHRSADGEVGYFSTIMRDISERKQLEQQTRESLERRGRQVALSTEVSQEIAAAQDMESLFRQVVELVQERFEYYHAHVYTLEEEVLVMQAGTGDAGRQMKEAGHQIELAAAQSLVARVARSGQPVLAPDVTQEPGWLPNPLLPETQAEIAVPIKLGEQVLGVLDVQNDAVGSLNEEDQLLLLGLCGQIAVAIEQQRLTVELESEQNTLRAILENIPLGVYVAEVPTGRPLLTNQRAEEMLGRGISPDAGPQDLAEVYAAYRQGTEEPYPQVEMPLVRGMGGEITTVDDMEIRRPDGSKVLLQVFGAPIVDMADQIVASVAIFQDITERRQAEAELEDRLRELNALQRAMSREGWSSLTEIGALPEGYLFDRVAVQPANDLWTPELGQAVESRALTPPLSDPNGHDRTAVAPLLVLDETVGALGVFDDPARPLTPDELALVEAVSEQVAQALDGARLFEETQRASYLLQERVKELNCLNEIGREIEESPPLPDLLQWVTERIPPAMQHPEDCLVAIEYGGQTYGLAEAIELPAQMAHGLYVSGELLGRIYIAYTQKRDFLDEESALLGGIATRLSSYIENQRLLESAQRRAEREGLVNTISQKIQSTTSVERALQTAVEELGQAFQSRYARIQLSSMGQTGEKGQQGNGPNDF